MLFEAGATMERKIEFVEGENAAWEGDFFLCQSICAVLACNAIGIGGCLVG